MRTLQSWTLAVLSCLVSLNGAAADIALIIDDMGNRKRDAIAFKLPTEVAFSILPHKALSGSFSSRAADQKREVILHIPMESLAGKKLGPGGLTSDMHPDHIHHVLENALASVPDAIGINNHMGSKLTQLTLPMTTTMDFLQQHELFFIDSRTTRFSKAEQIARKKGILSTKRNVFLDHLAEPEHIQIQFSRLIRLAQKYGFAVGIAHPYPETMVFLQNNLPQLDQHNIRLVPISEILQLQELARVGKNDTNRSALE